MRSINRQGTTPSAACQSSSSHAACQRVSVPLSPEVAAQESWMATVSFPCDPHVATSNPRCQVARLTISSGQQCLIKYLAQTPSILFARSRWFLACYLVPTSGPSQPPQADAPTTFRMPPGSINAGLRHRPPRACEEVDDSIRPEGRARSARGLQGGRHTRLSSPVPCPNVCDRLS
jgi:hypothetical protein